MIIIYHADCIDGFTSAWIGHKVYPNAVFLAKQYGDTPPDVTDQDVLIVNFSFPRQTLIDMYKKAKTLTVIDHHKTAQAALNGLDYCLFDMCHSGAKMTWDYLFKDQPTPKLIQYTEDRDLWHWLLPKSQEISAYLATLPRTWEAWDTVYNRLENGEMNTIVELGEVALRVIDQYVSTNAPKARKIFLAGYTVPYINTTYATSELLNKLAENAPFAVGWFQRNDGKFTYSLRSYGESAIDVSTIARSYGGGGHAKAAGFVSDVLLSI